MKITDEQILKIASKLPRDVIDVLDFEDVLTFARELIALAQEVKPLEFLIENGVVFKTTDFGQYHIASSSGPHKCYVLFTGNTFPYEQKNKHGFDTYEEAASYVQADYAARTLANLKYGGKDD